MQKNNSHIQAHLDFLLNIDSQYDDGRFEVSGLYNSNTKNFSYDGDIEKINEQVQLLTDAQKNVYIVGATLNPSAFMEQGRSNDSMFYASQFVWADIDDEHNPDELKEKYKHCPPHFAVVTARVPHRRIQLWWRLKEVITDPDTLNEAIIGIAQNLGGDTSVINPTSLMRLGGTINRPTEKKKAGGRIDEATTAHKLGDESVHIEQILGAFPQIEAHEVSSINAGEITVEVQGGVLDTTERVTDGRDKYMSDMIYASILSITAKNGDWPKAQEVFDDCWTTFKRKAAERSGRSVEQDGHTPDKMAHKINSKLRQFKNGFMPKFKTLDDIIAAGKQKLKAETKSTTSPAGIPSAVDKQSGEVVDPVTGEVKEPVYIEAQDIAELDLDNIPPRAWLFGTMAARKYVTMIGASPGAGKSIFTMQVAVAASSGKPFGMHAPQEDNIKTWIYNNEEGEEELRRRLKGILIHNNLSAEDLSGRFFMNSGENRSICIARRDMDDGGVIHTPDYDALKAEVLKRGIDLLIIDPFAETHDLSENSNDEIKRVAGMYRSIAIECNCAVILVHHTRKGGSNDSQSSEHNGNMDNMRGAGSQLGVVRRVFTLAKMDEKTAKDFEVSPALRRWYVRLDDAKSNITAPAESAEWFKFKSLSICNGSALHGEGDSVGVLVHKTIEDINNEEAQYTGEERVLLLTRLARVFIKNSVDTATINKCAEMLLEDGYAKYKERNLRKIIPEYIKKMTKHTPVISEGYHCFFDMIEGKTRTEGNKICLHIKEISDF